MVKFWYRYGSKWPMSHLNRYIPQMLSYINHLNYTHYYIHLTCTTPLFTVYYTHYYKHLTCTTPLFTVYYTHYYIHLTCTTPLFTVYYTHYYIHLTCTTPLFTVYYTHYYIHLTCTYTSLSCLLHSLLYTPNMYLHQPFLFTTLITIIIHLTCTHTSVYNTNALPTSMF